MTFVTRFVTLAVAMVDESKLGAGSGGEWSLHDRHPSLSGTCYSLRPSSRVFAAADVHGRGEGRHVPLLLAIFSPGLLYSWTHSVPSPHWNDLIPAYLIPAPYLIPSSSRLWVLPAPPRWQARRSQRPWYHSVVDPNLPVVLYCTSSPFLHMAPSTLSSIKAGTPRASPHSPPLPRCRTLSSPRRTLWSLHCNRFSYSPPSRAFPRKEEAVHRDGGAQYPRPREPAP